MKKIFFGFLAFIGIITISTSFKTNEPPGYKNLKILPKDISKEDLDSIMHHFSASLSVRCGFCHVHNEEKKTWDMASDENPYKLIARKMMLMTNDINKKYFPPEKDDKDAGKIQTITCYTCHKGDPIPAFLPPPHVENNK